MVSVGASKLGKTSIFLIAPSPKVNREYYRNQILARMLPELNDISGGAYIFQQDGARAHTAADTIAYLAENTPEYIVTAHWPPNSADLNPVDYSIWNELERNVHRIKKFDNIEELKEAIVEEWSNSPQERINPCIDRFRQRCHLIIDTDGSRMEHMRK